MGRRTTAAVLIVFVSTLLFVIAPVVVSAGGYREEVAEGNRALLAGEYETARSAYEKAGVTRPESPYLIFNEALLSYRTDDLDAARTGFEEAALKTKDLSVEALCHYNLGNVSVREAERLIDGDLEGAIGAYESAVNHFQRSLEIDPDLEDAAINTEVVRIILKDLLDKLARQQEEGQDESQEKLQEIVERLAQLIEDEAALFEKSGIYRESEEAGGAGVEELASSQRETREATEVLANDMSDLEAAMASSAVAEQDQPLSLARGHVENAAVDQTIAENRLGEGEVEQAQVNQKNAVEYLLKALDELTDDQEQQQEQQQQEQQAQAAESEEAPEEAAPEDAANERAEDILDEEEENREQRAIGASGRYTPVDKDW